MAKTDFQNEVINRIRQLRIDHELSQIGLANVIDVSNGQIGNIESPKFRHKYTLKQLDVIARYFNVPFEFLLTGSCDRLETNDLIKALVRYDE